MKVIRSGKFRRMLVELGVKDEKAVDLAELQIKRFQKNPKDTRLKVHPLKRRMRGKWAFSVDEDIRVVFEPLGKNMVRFLAIGGHPKVYRQN